MKYLPIEIINSDIDACLHHSSNVCTCSSGNGLPWVFPLCKPMNDKREAMNYCEKEFKKRFKEYKENHGETLTGGWEWEEGPNLWTIEIWKPHIYAHTPEGDPCFESLGEEWLVKFDFIEIED